MAFLGLQDAVERINRHHLESMGLSNPNRQLESKIFGLIVGHDPPSGDYIRW
jgi:hypothetical protein